MSPGERRLAAATAEADAARARVADTVVEIQRRLSPRKLLGEAAEEVREHAGAFAQGGLNFARERPAAVSGVVGAALLFLFRGPLGRLLRKSPDVDDET